MEAKWLPLLVPELSKPTLHTKTNSDFHHKILLNEEPCAFNLIPSTLDITEKALLLIINNHNNNNFMKMKQRELVCIPHIFLCWNYSITIGKKQTFSYFEAYSMNETLNIDLENLLHFSKHHVTSLKWST